ncbi:MAG: hypothetical protein U0802_20105 [Candidatus Binatia bacterium]
MTIIAQLGTSGAAPRRGWRRTRGAFRMAAAVGFLLGCSSAPPPAPLRRRRRRGPT